MTVRFEGCEASSTVIEVLPGGTELGEYTLKEPAVVFGYDEVFYMEGTVPELRRKLTAALEALNTLSPTHLAPITDCQVQDLKVGDTYRLYPEDEWTDVVGIERRDDIVYIDPGTGFGTGEDVGTTVQVRRASV